VLFERHLQSGAHWNYAPAACFRFGLADNDLAGFEVHL
jgi:hypothetical protein